MSMFTISRSRKAKEKPNKLSLGGERRGPPVMAGSFFMFYCMSSEYGVVF